MLLILCVWLRCPLRAVSSLEIALFPFSDSWPEGYAQLLCRGLQFCAVMNSSIPSGFLCFFLSQGWLWWSVMTSGAVLRETLKRDRSY